MDEIGSNPHSKGDIFSWSMKDFFEIKMFKSMIKVAITMRINIMEIIIIIIYINLI